MARFLVQRVVRLTTGAVVNGATVNVYENETTTPLAQTLYAGASGGTTVANPITTGANGTVTFWLDTWQKLRLRVSGTGLETTDEDNVHPLGDLSGLVTTSGAQTVSDKTLTDVAALTLVNEGKLYAENAAGAAVQLLRLEADGTVRLMDDSYFYANSVSDADHLANKVLELRNPNSDYPVFLVPMGRNAAGDAEYEPGDSKVVVQSMHVLETADPPEINFLRTGTSAANEHAAVASDNITGILRWFAKFTASTSGQPLTMYPGGPGTAFEKVAEIVGRAWHAGTTNSVQGAIVFQVRDGVNYATSLDDDTGKPGIMVVRRGGIKIAEMGQNATDNSTIASMFEVASLDQRPVLLRRQGAGISDNVDLAFVRGDHGTAVDTSNLLARVRAVATAVSPTTSTYAVYTNQAGTETLGLKLPVPSCRAYNSSALTLSNGVITTLNLDSERWDTDSMHYPSAANLTGTVSKTASSSTLAGSGTAFTSELSVGQVISVPGGAAEKRVVTQITDDTTLTVNTAFGNTAAGQTATRVNAAIVARTPGIYLIQGHVNFTADADGRRGAFIYRNDSGYLAAQFQMAVTDAGEPTQISVGTTYQLSQWDFVELRAVHLAGGNLDVTASPTYSPELVMTRIG